MTIRTTLLAGFAVLTLSLGGCASLEQMYNATKEPPVKTSGVQEVTLHYPPKPASAETGESAEAAMAPAALPATAPVIAIVRFQDMRADREVLGYMRNTFGMRTANVVAATNVSAWVTDALKWELEQAGYRVTVLNNSRAAQPAGAVATVSGEIVRLNADDYFFNEGEVILRTKVAKNGKRVLDHQYTGNAGGRFKYEATGGDFAGTLSQALHNGLQDMVADIIEEAGK